VEAPSNDVSNSVREEWEKTSALATKGKQSKGRRSNAACSERRGRSLGRDQIGGDFLTERVKTAGAGGWEGGGGGRPIRAIKTLQVSGTQLEKEETEKKTA